VTPHAPQLRGEATDFGLALLQGSFLVESILLLPLQSHFHGLSASPSRSIYYLQLHMIIKNPDNYYCNE
jgi:hypothetical protein